MITSKLNKLSRKYNWKALFSECNLSRNTRPSTIVAAPNRTVLAGCGKPGVGQPTGKQYQKQRVHLAEDFYRKYNCIVFDNRLPEDTSITWSKRMTKKAGQAVLSSNPREGTKTARIELSEKMLTDVDRLKNTLLHEMCHVATWLLDGFEIGVNRHHGPLFKKWAAVVHKRVPEVVVNTYHTYEAHKPFRFQCIADTCKTIFKCHSKKGIDISRHVCGACRSKLKYVGKFELDGTLAKERTASAYSNFVKEHFSAVKKKHNKLTNPEIMKKVAEYYKASRQNEIEGNA